MTTGHVFMAMSLDGFVARKDHSLEWLMKQPTEGEDHGYNEFEASIDGLIMGSGSFSTVLSFEEWPYKKPVIVMSKSLTQQDVPAKLGSDVRVVDAGPGEVMSIVDSEGWARAYVDGGQIVQSFLRDGLIADLTVTLIPILLGDGLRLFGDLSTDIDLTLIKSKSFKSGLVSVSYAVGS